MSSCKMNCNIDKRIPVCKDCTYNYSEENTRLIGETKEQEKIFDDECLKRSILWATQLDNEEYRREHTLKKARKVFSKAQ